MFIKETSSKISMTSAVYLGESNMDPNKVYIALKNIFGKDYGLRGLPEKLDKSGYIFPKDSELISELENKIFTFIEKKDFLFNILVSPCNEPGKLQSKLGFVPQCVVAFFTYSDVEPEVIKKGIFAKVIAERLKEQINCRYGLALMNPESTSYIRDI